MWGLYSVDQEISTPPLSSDAALALSQSVAWVKSPLPGFGMVAYLNSAGVGYFMLPLVPHTSANLACSGSDVATIYGFRPAVTPDPENIATPSSSHTQSRAIS